jgi:pimeloyl-ACP methyl ester carboxylesterase
MIIESCTTAPGFTTTFENRTEKSTDPLTALMLHEPHIEPALLKDITIPVLITAGEHDLIKAEETRRIAESLPQSKLTIVKNADHGSYVVNSEIMGELLIQFLEEHNY